MSDYSNLTDFLIKHQIKNASLPSTHTRIGNKDLKIYGGNYHISTEELPIFYDLYYNYIFVQGKHEYLTEKQNGNAMAIDLDFRYSHDVTTRQHTKEDIESIVVLYLEQLKQYFEFNSETKFDTFIFEKPNVNRLADGSLTKDGIHIVFGLKVDYTTQLVIRDKIIKQIPDVIDLPLINSWDIVFDEGISKGTTNWQLFGSRKPDNEAYQLTKHYLINVDNVDGEFMMVEQSISDFDFKNNFQKLSIQTQSNPEFPINQKNMLKIKLPISNSPSSVSNNFDELDEYEKLLLCISDSKIKEHKDWINVGQALKNELKDNANKYFINWTTEYGSDNKKKECYDYITKYIKYTLKSDKGRLSKGSLIYWAKENNLELYNTLFSKTELEISNIFNEEHDELLIQMINSQTEDDIAKYFVKLYGDKFKCVSKDKKGIYYFYNGTIWEETNASPIREMLSNEFKNVVKTKSDKITDKLKTVTDEEHKVFLKKTHKIFGEIIIRLSKTNDKNNITREVTDKILDYEFTKKLDINKGKLAFKNGIMNLETLEFQTVFTPEDYISNTIPYDYKPHDETKYQTLKERLKEILNYNDAHLEYYLCAIGHSFTALANKEKSIYFCVDKTTFATGDNGKTFFFDILSHLLPNYVYKTKATFLEENNKKVHKQLVHMKGKRLVWLDEFSHNKINSELLKELADGLTTENEIMFGTSEIINILFKLFILTNNLPNIDCKDTAVYNRYKQISYGSHFDRTGARTEDQVDKTKLLFIADTSLSDTIKNEYYNEVFQLIIEYAHKYYEGNKLPPIPSEFTKDALETKYKNDEFAIWFDENCERVIGYNVSLEEIISKSGMNKKIIRLGMERQQFIYNKDLSKGLGKSPSSGKQYKGGYENVRFIEIKTEEE
jgi:dephospho-CoA kinase